jgi:phage terminase large subunit-like protein
MSDDLGGIDGVDLAEIEEALLDLLRHRDENRLDYWRPYPKQRDFIAMGAIRDERLLMAPNQAGKSACGAYEMSLHLTGLYPADWPGRRWRRPTNWWAAGVSGEAVRDIQQTMLCGDPMRQDAYGTGFIPRHCLKDHTLARAGVAGLYDTVAVQHHTDGKPDGLSRVQFKAYTQGQMRFQGRTLDGVWWDEEPEDMGIYTEGNARWTATGGMSFMTFTPWHGRTAIVRRFMDESNEHRGFVKMSCEDAPHLTADIIESMKSKYPEHEWPARIYGDPALGAGQIFTTDPGLIKFPRDLEIPPHWAKIWGLDFGIDHPFAAVLLACDRDTQEDYIVATYRVAGQLPIVHSDALRRICAEAPVAWPHDGNVRSRGEGGDLVPLYKQFDLKMLSTHAHYPGGGYSTEAAVMDMQQGFQKAGGPGGLRVREDLADFWEEYRNYHREITKDGGSAIVKRYDDLISATQKALMMKRYARAVPMGYTPRPAYRHSTRPRQAPPTNPWTGAPI